MSGEPATRRARLLRPLRRQTFPSIAVWFDVESDRVRTDEGEERHVLKIGQAAFRRRLPGHRWSRPQWLTFEDPGELWPWIEDRTRPRTRLYLYAHNAAYDLTVAQAWGALPALGFKLTRAVLDAPPFIAHWKREDHRITVIDTLNYWRMPLAAIGEHVGLPKLPMPDENAPRAEWTRYNRRDVEIIMEACVQWWAYLRKHRLGSAAQTIAAQAMAAYRSRFLSHEILFDANSKALSLARDAYHGGRCECFRVGRLKGPLYVVDVRSEYPAMMREYKYPSRLVTVCHRPTRAEIGHWITNYAVVARVDLSTELPIYPLRVRSPLLFPVGQFQTVLTTPELAYALAQGHVRDIRAIAVYEHAPIFRRYVDALHDLRLEAEDAGDRVGAWSAKLLLNSLYGKFGQRGWRYRTIAQIDDLTPRIWTEFDADSGRVYRMRQVAGMVQEHWQEGEARYSHPAIAAHVTGYGRLLLWDLVLQAERSNVYYVDTDSLLVNQAGYDNLAGYLRERELGYLELEEVADSAVLHTPKDYSLGPRIKTKGVRSSATWINENTVEQERWLGIRSLLYRGDVSAPIVQRQVKRLERRYRKGVVLDSGRVRPYRLPAEWGEWNRGLSRRRR